ncbi:MAG TPA: class I SAM-dependent methyltransferase [Chitinophagaceae bacterium]|nr:class I SAM-dependent methyltransferase [Chitinophagaceae bacterium]
MKAISEDPIGKETLESFSKTKRFNKWQYGTISTFFYGNILEIGSGIGNISSLLLANNSTVTLSDLRKSYCDILHEKFKTAKSFNNIIQIDLSEPDFENKYSQILGSFDTIVALNVIEHIKNDGEAIENCKRLLRTGGQIIIQVPAFQLLYNSLDKGLGHYKRYTRKTLNALVSKYELKVQESRYFNFIGIPGWWLSGSLLKKKIIPRKQAILFDRLVPIFRIADTIVINRMGLSVITVAKKQT